MYVCGRMAAAWLWRAARQAIIKLVRPLLVFDDIGMTDLIVSGQMKAGDQAWRPAMTRAGVTSR